MRVAIAGGHGQIARHLERMLVAAGHEAVGLVRNPDHVADLETDGAKGRVLDLEHASVDEVVAAIGDADAVVFAAGAGPDSGAARKETVDRAGASLLADAAEQAGVRRYVMVSAMGVERADPDSDDVFQVYLRAKAAADADLRGRAALEWVIVRPGLLTGGPPRGTVAVGPDLPSGEVSRADVAAVLLAVLESDLAGVQFDLLAGDRTVTEAVAALGT